MNITVLGAGAWGTALAIHFAKQHHQVRLWARDTEHVLQMKQSRSNERYLAGFVFPPQLTLETDLQAAISATELLLIATPVAGLRPTLEKISPHIGADIPVMTACKGFEVSTGKLPHQVVADVLPQQQHIA